MNDIRMKLIQLMMEVHFQIPAEQFHAANRINWHIFHQTTNPMMSHREGRDMGNLPKDDSRSSLTIL